LFITGASGGLRGQGDLAVMSIETYEKLVGKFELYKFN
jgi:hypothetical protein